MIVIFLLIGLLLRPSLGCQNPVEGSSKSIPSPRVISGSPKLVPVGSLPAALTECSGMVELSDDLYVGNNDGGDGSNLYMFSLKNKTANKTIQIRNADNFDWEELTEDDDYVYIGDTGNNSGTRKQLAIYRVRKDDLKKKKEAAADKITFVYSAQKNFKPSGKNNFDCEAMICVGDSLYLFTKNRGNQKTDAYVLLKQPGDYVARHVGQYDAGGLVTSADWRSDGITNQLVLIGYKRQGQGYIAFMTYFPQVTGTNFFANPGRRTEFNTSLQIESVLFHDHNTVYVSNEEEHGQQGLVYKVSLDN